MPEQPQPFLRAGEIIPAFSLPGADGMPHSPWDYKQREHLLIVLLSKTNTSEARGILSELKQQNRVLREEECAVLVLTADAVIEQLRVQEDLQLPFPLLADPQGAVIAQYTHWEAQTRLTMPSLVLANRYGALYAQWMAKQEADLPRVATVLEDLQYMNSLCTP